MTLAADRAQLGALAALPRWQACRMPSAHVPDCPLIRFSPLFSFENFPMFKTFLAATAVAAFTLPAHAVTVAQWDFEAVTAPTAATTSFSGIAASTGNGTASGVHATAAVFSTPSGNGSAKAISANTWAVGDYWQFNFSTVGFTGVSLSFDQTGSGTGPRDFTVAYSTNGTTFINVSSYTVALSTWTPGTVMAGFTTMVNLAGIAGFSNNPLAVIRLIDASTTSISGATVAAGGTDRVDNFTVMATPVPEPGTCALLLAGMAAVGFVARRRNA